MNRTTPFKNWNTVPLLFGLHTASIVFDTTEETLKRLAAKGEVPAKKMGGKWMFEKTRVMEYFGIKSTDSERIRDLEKEVDYLRRIICESIERRDAI